MGLLNHTKSKILKRILFLSIAVITVVTFSYSCSRSKDTFTSRLYHQTTSKFNGYFYANESLNEGIATLEVQHKDDWKNILPVFIYGTDLEAKNIYPQMDRAILKTSTVIDHHAMTIKKKEENKWIKYNYLVMGKAYFYKHQFEEATKVFDYIIKQYKDEDIKYDATLWMARTKIELEDYGKALSLLKLLDEENLPKEILPEFKAVYADFQIRNERYPKAIEKLEEAIVVTKDRKRRARLTYILAQLYEIENRSNDAINAYQRVVKMHPYYEMVFYASINQAMAYNTRDGDSQAIKKLLKKMIKDRKNVDYYDQIYYALATLELEENKKDQAIEYFILSTKTSLTNVEQKGISFLALGNIYMDDRLYKTAKSYYDSTLIFLPKENEEYKEIADLDRGLGDLIINLDVIALQDSLIHLASLTDKEREKIILGIIAAEEKAEDERIEALLASKKEDNRQNLSASNPLSNSSGGAGNGKGDWYFYNPSSMSFGYSEFQRIWGSRTLQDNWRRSNSSSRLGLPQDAMIDDQGNDLSVSIKRRDIKSLNEYLADIPLTDEGLAESEALLEEALYNAGVIYNEELNDVDNAIEMFDELTQRFPKSKHLATSYYQLYRLYVKKENEGNYFGAGYRDNSEYYKAIILEDFPLSEYAKIIRNPNYLKEAEIAKQRREEDYMATYRNFKSHRYDIVMQECNRVIQNETDNPFLAKYYFMKAYIVGQRSDQANFERELQLIADKFPDTEEGKEAVEIINQLNKKNLKVPGKEDAAAKNEAPENKSEFIINNDVEHFFALIYPNNKGNVNDVKVAISNFNKKYYSNDKLKVTNSFINKENQIVIVRRFTNADNALSYYTNFINDTDQLKETNEEGYIIFLISSKNFTKLFKSGDIEGYDAFFKETYL